MKFVKTITLLMTFCVMAFGNNDRINALGGNAGFWPDDDANVTLFPAMVNSLDMVQVTGAGAGNGTAKVIWGEGTTWGFSFDGASETSNNDMVNLMWGNGTYGTIFSFGMSSNDDGLDICTLCDGTDGDGIDGANTSNEIGVSFGMNMDFGEIGVNFATAGTDDGTDGDQFSNMKLGFNLRRSQELWLFDNMLVGFSMDNDTQGDSKDNDMNLSVDLFTSLPTGDGVNATFAMGFGYYNNTYNSGEGDDVVATVISLPSVNLGIEADVTDWATVRFGMGHAYTVSGSLGDETYMGAESYKAEDGYYQMSDDGSMNWSADRPADCTDETCYAGENWVKSSDFNWGFGLGFDYGSFTLDMVLENTNLFNDPVRYVTGRNNEALSSSATLTWNF